MITNELPTQIENLLGCVGETLRAQLIKELCAWCQKCYESGERAARSQQLLETHRTPRNIMVGDVKMLEEYSDNHDA